MATPIIGSGILLQDNEYAVGAHVDSFHLYNMMKDAKPTDIGPIEFWAQTQAVQMPLYSLTDFGKSGTIMVDDPMGRYTWQSPIAMDLPYITRDIDPTDTKKGLDGRRFRICLNRGPENGGYSHTDVLTYDKFNGVQFRITEDKIISMGNNEYVYTCEIVKNSNTTYLSNAYLTMGTKVVRITSARSQDYGEKWSETSQVTGYREFYNIMGNAEANASYSISKMADAMIRGGQRTKGVPVTEIFKMDDPNLRNDPSIRNIQTLQTALGGVSIMKAIEAGKIDASFITEQDKRALTKIAVDIETNAMWGQGGIVGNDGPDQIRLNTGLWQQANNGYKKVYNIGTFTMDMFRGEIYNYYVGKVNFEGPDPQRELIVQTGIAGMQQANEAILKMAVNSGLVTNASEIGAIKGSGMDLHFGFAYTSYVIPFLANVKFVINPAFDNVEANNIENPMINGFRLSSYSYIIFDITDRGNDNIKLLQDQYNHELTWMHQNGTADYMGKKVFSSAGDFSGYRVKMMKKHICLTVLDPSRLLKIVATNPITGGSL